MVYKREIDGLRAVAVLPVILFHAGFETFRGGYVGVDVFFVISGYLITSILINDLERGGFSIFRFYERRARRILPALFTVIVACIPPAFLWMTPAQMQDFTQSIVAVVFFASNILFWREEGYFAAASELKPLLHTWSLAVEEQYYLIFPLLLLIVWPLGRRRAFWILAGTAAASLGFSEWGTRNLPGFTFYLAPTRAWELFAGGLCAFASLRRPQGSSDLLSGLGLALIVAAILGFDRTLPFPGLWAVVPVLGTMLIILFAGAGTAVQMILSTRPLVGIGLISYSAYLWHQPLFAFARIQSLSAPPPWLMLSLGGASLLLAWGSWRLVEQPFRRGQGRFLPSQRGVFAASATVAALLAAFGYAGHRTDGFRSAYLALHPEREANLALVETARQEAPYQGGGDCVFHVSDLDPAALARIRACRAAIGPGLLVLGDSHAIDLFGIVARQNTDGFVVGLSRPGCRPHSDRKGCHYNRTRALLQAEPGLFRMVIYEQAGFYLLQSDRYPHGSRRMFDELPIDGAVPDFEVNAEVVETVVDYLEDIATHVPVVWFGPRTEPHIPLRFVLEHGCTRAPPLRIDTARNFTRIDTYLRQRLARTDIQFLSQSDLFRFRFPEDFGSCDGLWWSDGDHLSADGEAAMAQRGDVAAAAEAVANR